MPLEDEKLENILADPWLARPATRWSMSMLFVLVVLFALKPLIVRNLLARAEAYTSYGLYNNAARECKKAIFLDGDNMLAWNTLGSSYKNQDDVDNAVNTYLNAININPANKNAHFKVAMIFALEQNYNRAIPHFERVRSLGPESLAVFAADPFSYYRSSLEMLSLCYERTGKSGKQQIILEELARTYSNYKKAADKLQTLGQTAQTLPNTD
jgi:tetratricopeptide (TPR) repeat protein